MSLKPSNNVKNILKMRKKGPEYVRKINDEKRFKTKEK